MSGLLDETVRSMLRDVFREELRSALDERDAVAAPKPGFDRERVLITVQEAARRAVVDEATVRTWTRKGVLRAYRAGRHLRVDPGELDAYLARNASPAPTIDLRQKAREFLTRPRKTQR